ncbi:MAG: hypothetical protein EZS28_016229 [Streblomastix strix]|uniref:Uncharacterized protein n=1 Tax=Streblomastix strix TaxID=222440 RepID=A0A5J4W139_9EUKA|nr:MAG: hypothetical protein EZS28_016229 [Streblomastix strix]
MTHSTHHSRSLSSTQSSKFSQSPNRFSPQIFSVHAHQKKNQDVGISRLPIVIYQNIRESGNKLEIRDKKNEQQKTDKEKAEENDDDYEYQQSRKEFKQLNEKKQGVIKITPFSLKLLKGGQKQFWQREERIESRKNIEEEDEEEDDDDEEEENQETKQIQDENEDKL